MARVEIDEGWTAHIQPAKRDLLAGRIGPAILADAQTGCPVDTGALLSSLHQESADGGNAVRIVADAKARGSEGAIEDYTYAVYVELGTRNMSAEPFMRPALFRQRGA